VHLDPIVPPFELKIDSSPFDIASPGERLYNDKEGMTKEPRITTTPNFASDVSRQRIFENSNTEESLTNKKDILDNVMHKVDQRLKLEDDGDKFFHTDSKFNFKNTEIE